MGKLYSLISALLLTVCATFAASPDSYEWWFDHDVSSLQTASLSGSTFDLQIDTSDLPKGIHYFNIRLSEGDSIYGPVFRKMFHSFGRDNGAISYEYWFDNDYNSNVSGSMDVGSNHLELDISSLPQGAHYFNCRVGYGDGSWGSVYRKLVLNLAGSVNAVAYEYWIDDNYSAKTAGGLSSGENSYLVDLTGVCRGLHRFNYRIMTGEGVWGAPFTSYFYSESNAARFTEYEYWLDNDYANRVTGNATGNPTSFEVDLSAFDKSGGAHYFNLRTRDGDGDWSPIYHKLLVFSETKKRQPVLGYRHYLNGDSLGYVKVERRFVDSYMFDINLPDSIYPSVKNRKPSFDGDKVYIAEADSIDYTMQIRTEFGWAAPQNWKLSIGNDFSTTAVPMEINSKHTFAAPTELAFAAMKFTAPGDSVYFHSDVPVALDIYKDGERVAALTPAQVKDMTMLRLTSREYFGVLYGVEDAEAKEFTLHLMDTPNIVPKPEISFEDGLVTMTCSRSDAEIHYTLDGYDPTEESLLYTEAFALNHNTTVKAKAFVRGSDIQPSIVAELIVDSFKTAEPYGDFNVENRLLTIKCDTEGATIYYTFDLNSEWLAYDGPFVIGENGIIYAKASYPGYNDSEISNITISDMKCAPVSITYNGRYIHLATTEPDARIRYSIDGSEPSSGEEYIGDFDVKGLANVRAVAIKHGYMNSDVADYIVNHYADEDHAATSAGGLLEAAFEWSGSDLPSRIEKFAVDGVLNDADYRFLNSMEGLRHLDIEKVKDAHIPENAFINSKLISINLPSDLTEYGDSILSVASRLSSVVWNSRTQNLDGRLTDGLANPNVLIYVPSEISVENPRNLNIITSGNASSIELHYGFPYLAIRDFHTDHISLTHSFTQTTQPGVCCGWETLVLPFSPQEITHAVNGPAVPFAAWDRNPDGMRPFWLYSSTSDGWEMASNIEACVPYIISMPNNPDYVSSSNLAGDVTFTASNVNIGSESSFALASSWINGTEFEGTFMPVEEGGLMSLNVNNSERGLEPGSAFVSYVKTLPFGAYVRGASSRKAIPLFGDGNDVLSPTAFSNGLLIETPAPGTIRVSCSRACRTAIISPDGAIVRPVSLEAGESVTMESLTRGLYIVGGVKVMVK